MSEDRSFKLLLLLLLSAWTHPSGSDSVAWFEAPEYAGNAGQLQAILCTCQLYSILCHRLSDCLPL